MTAPRPPDLSAVKEPRYPRAGTAERGSAGNQRPPGQWVLTGGPGERSSRPSPLPSSERAENAELLPHEVTLTPLRNDLQCRLYQAAGLPQWFIERVHDAGVPVRLRRAAGQWRLDWPTPRSTDIIHSVPTVLAVVEAVLTRGALTCSDPAVEDALPEPERELITDDDIRNAVVELVSNPTVPFQPAPEREVWGDARGFVEWFEQHRFREQGWTLVPGVEIQPVFSDELPGVPPRFPLVLAHPEVERLALVEFGTAPQGATAAAWRQWLEARSMQVLTAALPGPGQPGNARLQQLGEWLGRFGRARAGAGPLTDLRAARFAHQVQVAVFEAFRGGHFPNPDHWPVAVLPPARLRQEMTADDLRLLLEQAVAGVAELIYRVACLHEVPLSRPTTSVALVPGDRVPEGAVVIDGGPPRTEHAIAAGRAPYFFIRDLPLGINVAAPVTSSPPVRSESPSRDDARWMLRYLFRKHDFWEGQWETVQRTLQGKDSLVLLPTGGGKSIAFQLGALCLPGVCIAVDPIISLIDDQVDNLQRMGIDRAVGITSQVKARQEREAAMNATAQGRYLFCYVAPERFQIAGFRDALRQLTANLPVSLIAIDEAHCVSEWGHDFRTSYLNLARIAREYCAKDGQVPPLVGLTGTASYIVLRDVQNELQITDFDAIITPNSFDRQELKFEIVRCRSDEKIDRLVGLLTSLPSRFGLSPGAFFDPNRPKSAAGLVFCPFVRGEFGVQSVQEKLIERTKRQFGIYAGDLSDDIKRENARQFKRNRLHGLVCTKAFGMGIDKPNIRYTIHFGLPDSIESFYQEAGRAGRDRERAYSFIILSDDWPNQDRELLDPKNDISRMAGMLAQRRRDRTGDDVTRALWFHTRAFRGRRRDLETTRATLAELGGTGRRRVTELAWPAPVDDGRDDEWRADAEKALHRLVVIGVVEDYTIEYGARKFTVTVADADPARVRQRLLGYIRGYQAGLVRAYEERLGAAGDMPWDGFVLYACELLIDFIYEHIERARRRSLQEMFDAAALADGEKLRERILNYLTTTEYDDHLVAIATGSDETTELRAMRQLFDLIVSPNDAERVRGAAARYLTSYPDQPALLLVRAASEALSREPDTETVGQNVRAALQFGRERYRFDDARLARLCAAALDAVGRRSPGDARQLAAEMARAECGSREFLRQLARDAPAAASEPVVLVETARVIAAVDRLLNVS